MISKIANKFEEYFSVYSLAFITILIFIQVVMRYVFHNSLSWSEELARYIFLWLCWIGASFAVRERSHFRVQMLTNKLQGNVKKYFDLGILLIWFAFCVFLAYHGSVLTRLLFQRNQLSAAMGLPMGYAYASVPVGAGLMAFRLIAEIIKIFKGSPAGEEV
jgi:TRAP-type C4-dicarboxylate transport system permease small subunit